MISFNEFNEGPNDPAIFKAIFLAGGPGSGKSFIVGKTSLTAHGFKVVNSDDAFEKAMQKAKITMDPEGIFSAQGQSLRDKAKRITGIKMDMYVKGRLGLVIDGTGKDAEKIKKQATDLKALGYDVGMIFVNTDLDTAIKRNEQRPRSVPVTNVVTHWKAVQKNIGRFQGFFKDNLLILDNNEGDNFSDTVQLGYKWGKKFAESPIRHTTAKKWISQYAKEHLNIDEATDLSMDRGAIIDMILKDVRDKLMKDVMRNDLKLLKDIAAEVKRKVEIDFKHKGRLRIKT